MRFFTAPPSPTTCARPIALRRSVDRGCDARQLSTPLVRHSAAATSLWAAQPVLSGSARPQPLSPSSAAHPDVGGTPGSGRHTRSSARPRGHIPRTKCAYSARHRSTSGLTAHEIHPVEALDGPTRWISHAASRRPVHKTPDNVDFKRAVARALLRNGCHKRAIPQGRGPSALSREASPARGPRARNHPPTQAT